MASAGTEKADPEHGQLESMDEPLDRFYYKAEQDGESKVNLRRDSRRRQ
jgi:hypothetical protein